MLRISEARGTGGIEVSHPDDAKCILWLRQERLQQSGSFSEDLRLTAIR